MSLVVWPPGLPQAVSWKNYREVFPDATHRTQNDAGPDKIRRRTTSGLRNLYINVTLTDTQLPLFNTFFDVMTAKGSRQFDWVHPRSGLPVTMRFVAEPQISVVGGATYRASFQVEVLD